MNIDVKAAERAWILSVSGKLDAVSAPEYEKAVSALIEEGKLRIVVDFANLSYISSAGLRVLLSTAKQLKPKGGVAVFACLQDNVREVFEMTGFSAMLGIHPSTEAALAAL